MVRMTVFWQSSFQKQKDVVSWLHIRIEKGRSGSNIMHVSLNSMSIYSLRVSGFGICPTLWRKCARLCKGRLFTGTRGQSVKSQRQLQV